MKKASVGSRLRNLKTLAKKLASTVATGERTMVTTAAKTNNIS